MFLSKFDYFTAGSTICILFVVHACVYDKLYYYRYLLSLNVHILPQKYTLLARHEKIIPEAVYYSEFK